MNNSTGATRNHEPVFLVDESRESGAEAALSLQRAGLTPFAFRSMAHVLEAGAGVHPRVILLFDRSCDGTAGLQGLMLARRQLPLVEAVVIADCASTEAVVRYMLGGAFSVLQAPVLGERLVLVTGQALERRRSWDHSPMPLARASSLSVREIAARIAMATQAWRLTTRQRQVVEHVMRGDSNKETARRLGIAEATVECHLTEVFQRSGAKGRTALISRIWSLPHQAADRPSHG